MTRSVDLIKDYHIHVYFEAGTPSSEAAAQLREQIKKTFDQSVEIGRWHEQPVGPHPVGSYQVKFQPENFQKIVQWLSLNTAGLSILIHPQTGDELKDHTERALWLGQQLKLKLDIFTLSQKNAATPKNNLGI